MIPRPNSLKSCAASALHSGPDRRCHPRVARRPAEALDLSRLGALSGERLAQAATRLRPRSEVVTGVLRRLGERVERLSREVAEAEHALAALVAETAPQLLEECGVGPVCAAQLLVSSGEPSRMRSEASFAALAGTSPVDASSGKQQRHRLNGGGDRQLNRALHVITLQRIPHHPQTSRYYERLLAAGKTTREARRCIKRALSVSACVSGVESRDWRSTINRRSSSVRDHPGGQARFGVTGRSRRPLPRLPHAAPVPPVRTDGRTRSAR
jgi:hypothetical protein